MHEHRFILDVTRKNKFWVCNPKDKSCCDVSFPIIAGGDLIPEFYPGMPTITQLEDELRVEIYGQPKIYVALRRFFIEMKWFCIWMWTGKKRNVTLPPEYFGLALCTSFAREKRKFRKKLLEITQGFIRYLEGPFPDLQYIFLAPIFVVIALGLAGVISALMAHFH